VWKNWTLLPLNWFTCCIVADLMHSQCLKNINFNQISQSISNPVKFNLPISIHVILNFNVALVLTYSIFPKTKDVHKTSSESGTLKHVNLKNLCKKASPPFTYVSLINNVLHTMSKILAKLLHGCRSLEPCIASKMVVPEPNIRAAIDTCCPFTNSYTVALPMTALERRSQTEYQHDLKFLTLLKIKQSTLRQSEKLNKN